VRLAPSAVSATCVRQEVDVCKVSGLLSIGLKRSTGAYQRRFPLPSRRSIDARSRLLNGGERIRHLQVRSGLSKCVPLMPRAGEQSLPIAPGPEEYVRLIFVSVRCR
jgi:hypothetical protein